MARHIDLPIVSVTLLEDRAQVTRQATIELAAGVSRIAVDAVSPIIADKTLVGRIRDGSARVIDARVLRREVILPTDDGNNANGNGDKGNVTNGRDTDSNDTNRNDVDSESANGNDVDNNGADNNDTDGNSADSNSADSNSADSNSNDSNGSDDHSGARDSIEALERLRDDLNEQLHTLEAQQQATQEQCTLADQLAGLSLEELAIDAAWGTSPTPEASNQLATLDDRRRTLRAEIVTGARRITELQGRLQRLARRIDALSTPATEIAATLELDILAEEAGPVQLIVDYVVPGACWRPHHTAELLGEDELRFSTDASVWQNTGEDWSDVELSLSTERPSLGAAPPALSTDLLHVQRKNPMLQVQARDQAVQQASKGAASSSELPGIDDGGEVQLLRALARSSVPSDGRPHRVPLSTFTVPYTRRNVCYPELVESVLIETSQANGSERPILAGPVDLIRKSGLCGRTTLLFIGPRERFALGWGPEPELRLQRDEQIKHDDTSILSSWSAQSHLIELRLSNLGPHEQQLTIRERIPVSEIEKVKIEPDPKRTTGGKQPDSDGFLQWQLAIAPHATEDITLRYTLKKHNDVTGL